MILGWSRWDEVVFTGQQKIDYFMRWLRGSQPGPGPERRFIIIQIDGLAHRRLKMALEQGQMPFVRRLLQHGIVKETPFFVSLPTSTAAFHAGLFYGCTPDIPAWKYYDKRLKRLIHFPDPGAAALVEAWESDGSTGILKDGTSYGAVFSGDAETTVASFSRIYKPHLGLNWKTIWFFIPSLIALWVFLKIFALSVYELVYGLTHSLIDLVRRHDKRLSVRKVFYNVFFHVLWRELLTLGVSADIYRGVPRIFVNYLSYDVFAHKYGPSSQFAMRSLKAIDASIKQIYRIARRMRDYNYDIFVISDHGMAKADSFEEVSHMPLDGLLLSTLAAASENKIEDHNPPAVELINTEEGTLRRLTMIGRLRAAVSMLPLPLEKLCENYLKKREENLLKRALVLKDASKLLDEVKIVPAGPNVLVYFMHTEERVYIEEIEARYPGAVERLSAQPGIGVILARDNRGPVFYWQGRKYRVDPNTVSPECPFRHLTYRPLLMRAIGELLEMQSGGDLIIYGNGTGQGTISYLGERGSHAGFTSDELFAFIIYPKNIDFAFERVTRPRDLYQFFSRYLDLEDKKIDEEPSRRSA
jgi:hypothetical protein